jgi:hypothetical protein
VVHYTNVTYGVYTPANQTLYSCNTNTVYPNYIPTLPGNLKPHVGLLK